MSQYVADIAMPGLQHVAFVRSPHAHARVGGSSTGRREVPGVVAVVTGQDLKATSAIPVATASAEGGAAGEIKLGRQQYPLSLDRVPTWESRGRVIALARGRDGRGRPRRGGGEPLPAVAVRSPRWRTGAPALDDAPKNIEHTNTIKAGDPEAAFARRTGWSSSG